MLTSRRDAPALVAIVAVMLVQALYAVKLNAEFYREHVPFYDSCSYTKQLADIASVTRSQGFVAGIKKGLSGNVALPWLEMTALAKIVNPSRYLGVWLQSVWLAALALSLYWYFVHYRGIYPWLAVCLSLPFVSFAQVYCWNGGLPDFRMDLSLYIFVSLAAVWYLATYETESRVPWLLCGIAIMLACLSRATAPVYLTLMLAPLFAIRLLFATGRRKSLLLNCAWMSLPISLAVGVFLIYNFDYLYFYYVTWNPDANRHLPWEQRIIHLRMARSHVGAVLTLCSLATFAVNCSMGLRKHTWRIDWRLIWLASAPVLFLVFRGAGLNPHVSLPAVFGFLLFSYLPFRGLQPAFTYKWVQFTVGILLVGASVFDAATANQPQPYSGVNTSRMAGVRTLLDSMTQDAARRGLRGVMYVVPVVGVFHACVVSNVLTYEYGAMPGRDGGLHAPSGLAYYHPEEGAFTAVDELLWKMNVPGQTEEERMAKLVSMAMQLPDYMFFPDEATLGWLEKNRTFFLINLKARELKARVLATGAWTRLGDATAVSPDEAIELYRRRAAR